MKKLDWQPFALLVLLAVNLVDANLSVTVNDIARRVLLLWILATSTQRPRFFVVLEAVFAYIQFLLRVALWVRRLIPAVHLVPAELHATNFLQRHCSFHRTALQL